MPIFIISLFVSFITFYKPSSVNAACKARWDCSWCLYGPNGCVYAPFTNSYLCRCQNTDLYCDRGTCDSCIPPACGTGFSETNNNCGGDTTTSCYKTDCGGTCGTVSRNCYKLKYTVQYTSAGGGSCTPSSQSICYLASTSAPSCTRTGYYITSFSRTAGSGGTLNTTTGQVTGVTGAQTITANWAINQYTVTFHGNGGTCTPSSQSVNHGSNSSIPSCNRAGYHVTSYSRTAGSGGTLNTTTGQVTGVTGAQTIEPTWALTNVAPTKPTSLQTDAQINPINLTNINPQFTAIYNDPDTSDTSGYYQVQVNTSATFIGTSMWDSGKTAMTTTSRGSRSPNITYNGTTLRYNGTTYYWRIKFWDNSNAEGAWSDPANFTMAVPKSSYYEIEVNTASNFTGTVMWDSGKTAMTTITAGQRSPILTYAGSTLQRGVTYYWRIRFWDMVDNVSPWSDYAIFKLNQIPTAPTGLLTEGRTNPTDVTTTTPKFSALYNDPDSTDSSSYYEIEINTSSNFSGTVMWDSGKTAMATTSQGNRSPDILYNGSTLSYNITYYWRIKFWDSAGSESPWSSVATFMLNRAPTEPTDLLTEGRTNPNNIKDTTPEFSAIFNDPDSTDTSAYYQVEVNISSNFGGTVMWNSGKTAMTTTNQGNRCPDISYAGSTLNLKTLYYWRIKFWDSGDNESPWSSSAFFMLDILPVASDLSITKVNNLLDIYYKIYFSAIYTDPNADNSSNYQIQVNTASNFLGTSMWDSAKTATTITSGNRSAEIQYNGTTLPYSGTTYYVRMRFWDTDNNASDWVIGQFTDALNNFRLNDLRMDGVQIN